MFNEWQIYCLQSSRLMWGNLYLQLESAGFIILYDDMKPCSHNITINMTISVRNVKTPLLLKNGFSLYRIQLPNMEFKLRTYTTSMRQDSKWGLSQLLKLSQPLKELASRFLSSQGIVSGLPSLNLFCHRGGACHQ